MMPGFELNLLGPLAVRWQQQPLAFRSNKIRALLAYLALQRQPVRRETLAALLWGEYASAKAASNLRTALSQLRRSLQPVLADAAAELLISRQTVQLRLAPSACDVLLFDQQIAAWQQHQHPELASCAACLATLEQIAALYQGDLLAGLSLPAAQEFIDWCTQQAELRQQQALSALAALTTIYLARRDYGPAMRGARQQLQLLPWHESAHRQLIQALLESGQPSLARAQYESCRAILAAELGLEPEPATTALLAQIDRPVTLPAPQLPAQLTPLFGRAELLRLLVERMHSPACRLLTLTGPGGVGKTRLALAVAEHMQAELASDVWFVALAELAPGADAPAAVADQLALAIGRRLDLVVGGQSPQLQLIELLRERRLLLLLDNLEHLLAGAPFIDALLRAAPHLRLICTAREPLGLQAEVVVPLAGLSPPAASAAVLGSSCGQLFIERAQRSNALFQVRPDQLDVVRRICQLVEGLPLGLELAAAWTRQLSLEQIAAALEQSLDFLQTSLHDLPPRHRSLRAVFESSWLLLPPAAQHILALLTVFRGGFSAAAAHAVVRADLPQLAVLVDKSLLQARDGRYTLHELVRQFAAAKADPAALEQAQTAHSQHYLELMRQQTDTLIGYDPHAVADVCRQELENIRLAWTWAAAHAQWPVLDTCLLALVRLFDLLGFYHEGEELLALAVEHISRARHADAERRIYARLLTAQAGFLNAEARYPQAALTAQAALHHAQALGDVLGRAAALVEQGIAQRNQGLYTLAWSHLEQALHLSQAWELHRLAAQSLRALGQTAYMLGRYQQAGDCYRQALRLYQQLGDQRSALLVLGNLGLVWFAAGDYSGATRHYRELLPSVRALDDRWGAALVLNNLGYVLAEQGDIDAADDCYRQALDVRRVIGDRWGVSITLTNCGALALQAGQLDAALRISDEALHLAQLIGDRSNQAYALTTCGAALCLQQRPHAALLPLEDALRLRSELGQTHLVPVTQAWLALALLRCQQPDAAHTHALQALTALDAMADHEALALAWMLIEVLGSLGDARAERLLQSACVTLNHCAAQISDARLRHAFLYAVPAHARLLQLQTSATTLIDHSPEHPA